MKKILYGSFHRILADILCIMVVLLGLGNIIHSLPLKLTVNGSYYSFFPPQVIALHKSLSAIIGFALVIISYRLFKKVRTAWIITICLIPLSLFLHIIGSSRHITIFECIELLIILFLIFNRKDYQRAADPINRKWGILLAFISISLVILNSTIGLFIIKPHTGYLKDFFDAVVDSFQLLFFMDVSYIEPKTMAAVIFGRTEIILNWVSIVAALFLILKPLVYQPIITKMDKDHVRALLKAYGRNPTSYLALEDNIKYFFGTTVEGAIAYRIAGTVAVCLGDPICRLEDTVLLLSQFISFCKQNDHDICFCEVTADILKYFSDIGFGITKYGEEAMFDLTKYNLSGGKTAQIRSAIHHSDRLGISVIEYAPTIQRDKQLEEQIGSVSEEWLKIKKSSELSFMLGSISLNNPMDRRYFVALDENKNVLGFIVFVPFAGGKGYMTDVTRRRKDAPVGVMEKIIITAFEKMREEQVEWGSMALAPLYNVESSDEQKTFINAILKYIYEHMNHLYGFKGLYQYKKKYAPTCWEPRYLAYYPNSFTPQIAYAIVKVQNPKGIKEYFLITLKNIFNKKSKNSFADQDLMN